MTEVKDLSKEIKIPSHHTGAAPLQDNARLPSQYTSLTPIPVYETRSGWH